MVILAAAAITAAGVGAYKGGQAVAKDVGKRARRMKTERARRQERHEEAQELERTHKTEEEKKEAMSVADRLNRFKRGVPGEKKKSGLFGRSMA